MKTNFTLTFSLLFLSLFLSLSLSLLTKWKERTWKVNDKRKNRTSYRHLLWTLFSLLSFFFLATETETIQTKREKSWETRMRRDRVTFRDESVKQRTIQSEQWLLWTNKWSRDWHRQRRLIDIRCHDVSVSKQESNSWPLLDGFYSLYSFFSWIHSKHLWKRFGFFPVYFLYSSVTPSFLSCVLSFSVINCFFVFLISMFFIMISLLDHQMYSQRAQTLTFPRDRSSRYVSFRFYLWSFFSFRFYSFVSIFTILFYTFRFFLTFLSDFSFHPFCFSRLLILFTQDFKVGFIIIFHFCVSTKTHPSVLSFLFTLTRFPSPTPSSSSSSSHTKEGGNDVS